MHSSSRSHHMCRWDVRRWTTKSTGRCCSRPPEVPWWVCNGQDDGWDNGDDVGTVGTLTTTEAGEISEDDDDEDEDYVPGYEDEADVAREDATKSVEQIRASFAELFDVVIRHAIFLAIVL